MSASDVAVNWPLPATRSSNIVVARLAIGLLQGLVLCLLYRSIQARSWPATNALVAGPLLLAWLIVPVIGIAGLGALARRPLLAWMAVAATITAALGVHDGWRTMGTPAPHMAQGAFHPSGQLIVVSAFGFFIAQSLVMAAASEKRRIASYPAYFETAWKQFVQLALSCLFVGVVWLVLLLGGELFQLIKLGFLRELLRQSWFVIPVIAVAFSCAMHITDVRPAIVRGIRTLLLVLMSWILPVAVLVIGGFLLSLPFTGLEPLWATRSATAVLLGAAALLVVLINAAYQDGSPEVAVARVIQASVRAAGMLLVPIVVIAAYALALRVGDYGWTTSRIVAVSCLIVASVYALGYAWAALPVARPGIISRTNIANAFVVVAMLLLLFSPVGDPARLSVASQVARLASGKVAVDKFDVAYLRFEGERYGQAALESLRVNFEGKDAPALRARIAEVQKSSWPRPQPEEFLERPAPIRLSASARVWPKGSRLPASFLNTDLNLLKGSPYPACLRGEQGECDIVLLDLTSDGKPEIVMLGALPAPNVVVVAEAEPGQWRAVGTLPSSLAACASLRQAFIDGRYKVVAPAVSDLQINGTRMALRPRWEPEIFNCPGPATE
ncbi:DUF4153 domain-containing protein [Massilia sp. GCM10020059]|uniref:DUF4153 domain-containing protein n=1 Tax=Massilia agrisoli TaxID=2892444 RepID=A0ABS8ITZ6_9BURK|nr:DUF4153 domain-containing protein [Massilia agrisoli]MCC6071292.1 DUF4153 domain-containing protein [Massilia agrisoli]